MSASRFPGKPLFDICGLPMIAHCYLRSKFSKLADEVYVATCDKVIYDYILSINGKAIMTSDKHERATERTAEAINNIEKKTGLTYDFVAMVQGDEPLVDPDHIDVLLKGLFSKKNQITNLMIKLDDLKDINDNNLIKVVFNHKMNVIYLSRETIPHYTEKLKSKINYFRQLGLIAFNRESLVTYSKLKMSYLEIIESVDMNRFIENGIPIKMIEVTQETYSVDVFEDIQRVLVNMKKDTLFQKYK